MCRRCRYLSLLFSFALIELNTAHAQTPALQIQLQKPGDTAVVQQEEGRTVIVVTSRMGIGQMTLTSKDAPWPKEVTLRLHYQTPHPFKTLEGFEFTSSRLQVRTNSSQSDKTPFFLIDDDGKFSRDDVNPSGWLKIQFKAHGDDMDVIFPSNLLRDEKKVHIQWVDFYRV